MKRPLDNSNKSTDIKTFQCYCVKKEASYRSRDNIDQSQNQEHSDRSRSLKFFPDLKKNRSWTTIRLLMRSAVAMPLIDERSKTIAALTHEVEFRDHEIKRKQAVISDHEQRQVDHDDKIKLAESRCADLECALQQFQTACPSSIRWRKA